MERNKGEGLEFRGSMWFLLEIGGRLCIWSRVGKWEGERDKTRVWVGRFLGIVMRVCIFCIYVRGRRRRRRRNLGYRLGFRWRIVGRKRD